MDWRETPNLITWLKLFDKDRGESGDPQPFLSYAAIRSDCLYLWYTEHFFFTFLSPGVHTLLHAIELCLLSPTICVLSCLPVPSLSFLFTLTLSWLHQKLNWFCRSFLPAKSVFFLSHSGRVLPHQGLSDCCCFLSNLTFKAPWGNYCCNLVLH